MSKDKILKKCNFCRSVEELNTEEIPFWSKKNENYSPYPKMITCDQNYSLKNEDLKEINPDLNKNSLEVKLLLGKENKDKFIFYWATNEQDNIHEINPPETSYGKYENHGLKKCDKYGKVILRLNCPQPYKDEKQTYCRHVHYIVEGPDKTWLKLKTIRVICTITIEELDEGLSIITDKDLNDKKNKKINFYYKLFTDSRKPNPSNNDFKSCLVFSTPPRL